MRFLVTDIHGIVVCKNEADRYLQSCLAWNSQIVDTLFMFDDQSTDNSVDIARSYCDVVKVREGGSSFMEHEGKFRQQAWDVWEASIHPKSGSYVYVFDTDQFMVGSNNNKNPRKTFDDLIGYAKNSKHDSVMLSIPEIWENKDDVLFTRQDGFWARNSSPHLFEFRPDGAFQMTPMGCGSRPKYVRNPMTNMIMGSLLHFGYLNPADRKEKFNRYNNLDQHGHNPAHIASIMKPPTLKEYLGQTPDWWRGTR